jgi:hypothetical protein
MSKNIEQLMQQELSYLRKTLDRYITSKIYNQPTFRKISLKSIIEFIENLWLKYPLISIFYIGFLIFCIVLFISVFIAIKLSIQNNLIIIYLVEYALYAILISQIFFTISVIVDFIVKPVSKIINSRELLENSYYFIGKKSSIQGEDVL